jgi:hypothetical protein
VSKSARKPYDPIETLKETHNQTFVKLDNKNPFIISNTLVTAEHQSRNKSPSVPHLSTSPDKDTAEIDIGPNCEEIECTSYSQNKPRSLTRHHKSTSELERDSIGYINDNFEFVVPKDNLNQYTEDYSISFDKLNIFKVFGLEYSSQETRDKQFSKSILQSIIQQELEKYKNNPKLRRIVRRILGQDELSY